MEDYIEAHKFSNNHMEQLKKDKLVIFKHQKGAGLRLCSSCSFLRFTLMISNLRYYDPCKHP